MNLFKKLSTLVFIFSFFVLGTILIPAHKANAAVTVNVLANPMTVNSGSGSTITWKSSAGVTSCSLYRSDTKATVYNLTNSGSYQTGALTKPTTFTVTCVRSTTWAGDQWKISTDNNSPDQPWSAPYVSYTNCYGVTTTDGVPSGWNSAYICELRDSAEPILYGIRGTVTLYGPCSCPSGN